MSHYKISELSLRQINAVWRSDQFCMLTDGQLASLHKRQQELSEMDKRRARGLFGWMLNTFFND